MKQVITYLFYLFLLCGCSQGNVAASIPSGGTSNSSSLLQISNISTIPSAQSTAGEYVNLTITNYLSSELNLTNTKIEANGNTLSDTKIPLFVDMANCLTLAKRSSCSFKVFTQKEYQSYLLTLTFRDNKGNSLTTQQVISFNNLLPNQNGFIYDATELSGNNSGLVVSFRLASDYSGIDVLINKHPAKFSCFNIAIKLIPYAVLAWVVYGLVAIMIRLKLLGMTIAQRLLLIQY